MNNFFKKTYTVKSNSYRRYNQAFYEEILIDFHVEQRISQNYREKFITTQEDIYLVLMMYCQNDYVNHFLKIDVDMMDHSQMVELFCICLKSDAFKIAIHIYLKYISQQDISPKILDIIMASMKDSIRFHEMKLFFINEHLDQLSII